MLFWRSKKNKEPKLTQGDIERIALDWYLKGMDRGIELASRIDSKAISAVRSSAIDEAIARLNGNRIQKT